MCERKGGLCAPLSQAGRLAGLSQLQRGQEGGGCQGPRRPCLRCPVPCREKLVQVSVELLSTAAAEKALVAVTLQLLAVLLARYEWRVPFATEGGVRAVLTCMQQHGCSALVQQAGLAVSECPGHGGAGGAARAARAGWRGRCPCAALVLAGPEGAGGSCGR